MESYGIMISKEQVLELIKQCLMSDDGEALLHGIITDLIAKGLIDKEEIIRKKEGGD